MFRALPASVTRSIAIAMIVAWAATMAVLVKRTYVEAAAVTLATDLARYGSGAQWRGVYYRGEKIGFTVSQISERSDGFELNEDGRLQMALFGAITAARIRTTARLSRGFELQSFEFLLDPGTGPTEVRGVVNGRRLDLTVVNQGGTTSDTRELDEPPILTLNIGRRLAASGLVPGARYRWMLFDPATLRSAPVTVSVGKRENIRAGTDTSSRFTEFVSMPAFRVEMDYGGLRTTSWISDTGEILREESPMGLMAVRENARTAQTLTVRVRTDLTQGAAVVPQMSRRIDDPRDVRRLRMRIDGIDLSGPDLRGVAQSVNGDVLEIVDPQTLRPGAQDPDAGKYLAPEPFIESADPAIVKEAETAVGQAPSTRARAERLVRYVNALLQKKPTVSLPSAREVLRTKVGDCNEHTVLYVAMARAVGIPARIAVGLTYVRGAFFYHAWPEVYIDEGSKGGYWLPVDPTLNQFPADATHLRLARGGLDQQAVILPTIGRLKIQVQDLELAAGSTPILAGAPPTDMTPLAISLPERHAGGCWSR